MKQNSGTPTGSRDTATAVLENGSTSKEEGRNADGGPVPKKSAGRIDGDSMQPTTGNDELAGGHRQDPKREPAGERRGEGKERHDVPSPGAEKDGTSKVSLVVASTGWRSFFLLSWKNPCWNIHCCTNVTAVVRYTRESLLTFFFMWWVGCVGRASYFRVSERCRC